MGTTVPASLVILHEAFARRMRQACDANDDIPQMNEGRLVWLQQQMAYQGHEISLQTAMRWYYGAAMPRQKKIVALSKALGVSPSWLSLGREDKNKIDTTIRTISAVTSADVLAVLNRLADTGRRETARRSKSVISGVFRLAVSTLRADNDPTHVLKGALLSPKVTHMAAITDEVTFGRLLCAIDESTGWWSVKAYLQFLAMTFVRPGAARLAKWSEVDLKRALWVVPAERMKMRRQHEVPLSRQAVDLLKQIRAADPYSVYLFPSLRTNRKPLSENAGNAALRKIGYSKEEMVTHGFRSSASTILNRRKFDRDVIEIQLAHAPNDRIRAIYNRDQMWWDRVKLMQRWSDMLEDMKML